MSQLLEIYGIGPKLSGVIESWLARDGVTWKTRKQLFEILLRAEYFDKLPEAARAYLTYRPHTKIPREIMAGLEKRLNTKLRGIKWVLSGSYSRKKPFSRDADIILVGDFDEFAKKLKNMILVTYARGNDKVSIILKFGKYVIKADVFITTEEDYIYTLLYATGSGIFNVYMRARAKTLGYMLNNHGLYRGDKKVRGIKTEADIFKKLNLRWIPPEERGYTKYSDINL